DIFLGSSGAPGLDSPSNQIAPGAGTSSLSSVERLTGGPAAATTSSLRQPPAAVGDPGIVGAGPTGLPTGRGPAAAPVLPGIRITPDVVNNALLIYANEDNYRIIERA